MEITQPLFPAITQSVSSSQQQQPQPQQPQSIHEIAQDFQSLSAFLASCECSKWEALLENEDITLKRLPNFQEQDFKKMGIALGAARDLDLALMKYRSNPRDPNENQVLC